MNSGASLSVAAIAGATAAAAAVLAVQFWQRRRVEAVAEVYELAGSYYQALGHAWDHERGDFKASELRGNSAFSAFSASHD